MRKVKGKKFILVLIALLLVIAAIIGVRTKNSKAVMKLPILMYHSVNDSGEDYTTTKQCFEEHLSSLKDAGYTAISFKDLEAYVNDKSLLKSAKLPDKPIIITFDDGYLNNYLYAYPLLSQYKMPATIFVVGKTMGMDVYFDGLPMEAHFSAEQATEMIDSGWISIEAHSYNMHQYEDRDTGTIRTNALKLSSETEEAYGEYIKKDLLQWKEATGCDYHIFSYPGGIYDELSEKYLRATDLQGSCTTEFEINTIRKGHPEDLWAMSRFSVHDLTAEDLIALLGNQLN